METERFKQLVARLERESAAAPGRYRAKVAALTALGFGILALLLGALGFGLVALIGIAVALAFSGGSALLLLAKFGKALLLLAIPVWYLGKSAIRALFVRLPAPEGRELSAEEAPELFAALKDMQQRMKGPRFHHVLVVDEVNAAVVQRPAFGLVGWPRNYLLLGLPLLEAMPTAEALAIVAHEYGHLAGSHGHFSAFIYRLRNTWGTIQAYTDQIQGWLGRLVAPLVRWYAPYFNAYTFVLARNDEFLADAAAAELVGAANTAQALKRVNVIASRHHRFMQNTFARMDHDAVPPPDLMRRWASTAVEPPEDADARRWLTDALDRVGDAMDTHPTLRARLAALPDTDPSRAEPPPRLQGASAAQAWLGARIDRLRGELETQLAQQLAQPWAERHAAVQQQRERLSSLRALASRDDDQQLELLSLAMRLEPQADLREALAAFNAGHPDHALGLFLEGSARLDKGDRDGLALLDHAIERDPEVSKAACERAYAFLSERGERDAAEAYAERWRQRNALERQREHQIGHVSKDDQLVPHGQDAATLQAIRGLLDARARKHVAKLFLARRVIPADPSVQQYLLGVELSWWGRRRGRQQEVVDRLAAIEWPFPLIVLTLEGRYAGLKARLARLADARLV